MSKPDHPPAFLFYPEDFSSDSRVEAMTTEEVGAYILLLCKSWRENPPGSIPTDDTVLARWARLHPDRWSECRTRVLAPFKAGTDNRLHQKRLRDEFRKFTTRRKQQTDAGAKAANARWNKQDTCDRNATVMREECLSGSVPIPSTSSKEKVKIKDAAPPLDLPVPVELWAQFVTHRHRKRQPMTDFAASLVVRKIRKLETKGHNAVELVETAIERGWLTVFEPDGGGNGTNRGNRQAATGAVHGTGKQYRKPVTLAV